MKFGGKISEVNSLEAERLQPFPYSIFLVGIVYPESLSCE